MQILQAAVLFGLVCLDGVSAIPAPTVSRLGKRSITIERVAVGWKERDVLHSKVKALEKFGMTVSPKLRAAHVKNRVDAQVRAKHRENIAHGANAKHKAGRGKHHGGGHGGSGNAGGGFGNGTAAASTSVAAPTATGSAGGDPAQATGEVGQVTNNPAPGDVEFLSQVSIGGQKIVMDFDTGSSDLWVFSTNLDAQSQVGHTVFDPSKSTTFKAADPALQSAFNISFGDGSSASGSSPNTIGTDVVDIGGAVSQAQTIELADTVSGSFVSDTASNGLVGLAFSSLNTVTNTPAKTFLDTIADDLEQPIFAANLKHDAPGSYSFGEVDATAFKGQLTEVPVDSRSGFWQFASSTFSIGDNGAIQQNTANSPAIADTGTTLMLADDDVIQAYYSQVQGAQIDPQSGQVIFPCSSTLPDLSVAIGTNYNAVIPGSLINFQPDDTGTTCLGGLQSNDGSGLQIYGDIFFKAQYAVFNIRKNSISLAPHA